MKKGLMSTRKIYRSDYKEQTALARFCKESMEEPKWEEAIPYQYHRKISEIRTHETMQIYATREINVNYMEPGKITHPWRTITDQFNMRI